MKRIYAVLLALLMVLFLTVPAIAATPRKIKTLHPDFAGCLYLAELDGSSVAGLDALTVAPGSQLRIYLIGQGEDQSLFFDQDDMPIPAADVSVSRLRAAQVSLSRPKGKDARAIQSVEFGYTAKTSSLPTACPYIEITFAADTASVKDIPFAYTLTLSMAGEVQEQTALEITGIIMPQQREVTAADTEVDIQDGALLVAREDVRGISVIIGEGISITANLKAGERYYGVATIDTEEVFAAAAGTPGEVLKIYSLQTVNLDRAPNKVRFESELLLYVYGADGAYLGTTDTPVAYSEQYYLTNRKAEVFVP